MEQLTSNIQHEPGASSSEQQQAVLGNGVVANEVAPAGFGYLQLCIGRGLCLDTSNLIGVSLTLACHISLDVVRSLLNVTGHIKSVSLTIC